MPKVLSDSTSGPLTLSVIGHNKITPETVIEQPTSREGDCTVVRVDSIVILVFRVEEGTVVPRTRNALPAICKVIMIISIYTLQPYLVINRTILTKVLFISIVYTPYASFC